MEPWILGRLYAKLWVGFVKGGQGQIARVGKREALPCANLADKPSYVAVSRQAGPGERTPRACRRGCRTTPSLPTAPGEGRVDPDRKPETLEARGGLGRRPTPGTWWRGSPRSDEPRGRDGQAIGFVLIDALAWPALLFRVGVGRLVVPSFMLGFMLIVAAM